MKKTLLIIGAGLEQKLVVEKAKSMDLYTVVSDMNTNAPAVKSANYFVEASTYDPRETLQKILKFRKRQRIDGVIAVGVDAPHTVAVVAKNLGLISYSLRTAKLATNKLLMKDAFKKYGVDTSWYLEVKNFNHLKQIVKNNKNIRLVIKPQDSRGGRGVLQLDKVPSLKWAYEKSRSHSPLKKVMVEEFLEGPQISTESFIQDGKIFTPGFIDREYPYLDKFAPYFIEAGGQQPTKLPAKIVKKVDELILKAAKSIDITNGVVKGDIVIHKGVPKVIEIAARLSGGYMSTFQIPAAIGVDLLGIAIKFSLGKRIDEEELIPRYKKGMAIRYWFPKPGRIFKIVGEKKLKQKAWIKFYQFNFKEGEFLESPTDLTKRAGFVICEGTNRLEAVERAKQALKMVKIVTI